MNYDDELLKAILDDLMNDIDESKRKLINLLRDCYIIHDWDAGYAKTDEEFIKCHNAKLMVPKRIYEEVNKHKDILDNIFNKLNINDIDSFDEEALVIRESKERDVSLSWTCSTNHFDEIVERILVEINIAKYNIWLSNPFLTDDRVYKALIGKAKEGIGVRVIIESSEHNNKKYSCYFQTYKQEKWGKNNSNLLHRKFCIIDFDAFIRGGRNLSTTANYNWEEISVSIGNKKDIYEYSEIFKKQVGSYLKGYSKV